MNRLKHRNGNLVDADRVPEARYAYHRRCQVFRRNGEQCKAPAEKGALICHAHAGQLAMAVRRERERRAVLAEAVAEMRRRGKPECEPVDLFMDFKGIQITLAKMAQALIDGRIDCKTAGRLVVQLQMASKMLWAYHRGHREAQRTTRALTTKDTKEHEGHKTLPRINTDNTDLRRAKENLTAETPTPPSQHQACWGPRTRRRREEQKAPQICADERRLSRRKDSTTKDTRSTPLSQTQGRSGQASEHEEEQQMIWAASHSDAKHMAANQGEETRIALVAEVRTSEPCVSWPHAPPGWAEPTRHQTRCWTHGPPEWARAA